MNEQLTLSRQTLYGGRNGISKLVAIQLFMDSKDNLNIFPLNTKGGSTKTFLEIPKEDIPALIALLQESIGQTPAPANNGDSEVRTFHLTSLDSEAGSLGLIKGATAEELNRTLTHAIQEAFNADGDTVTIPEIDWNFWRRRHAEEVVVSFLHFGQPRNETIELTYTWEA